MGTEPIRSDHAANSGVDHEGYQAETLLHEAVALILMYAQMKPRSKKHNAADPHSAMQKLRGVRREHTKRGITIAPSSIAMRVMTSMMRDYITAYSIRGVARKKPLTNAMINGMLACPQGAKRGDLVLSSWSEYYWIAVAAWVSLLAESG